MDRVYTVAHLGLLAVILVSVAGLVAIGSLAAFFRVQKAIQNRRAQP